MSKLGNERHRLPSALERYMQCDVRDDDAATIDAHLAVCKSARVTPGKCHDELTRIEDEFFSGNADAQPTGVKNGWVSINTAPELARLMRITHDRRVARGICFSEAVLRAAVDNATPERRKVRTHARACKFCKIYLPGSFKGLVIGASHNSAATDGKTFAKPDSDSGPGPRVEDELRMHREARTPFEVETGVRPEDVLPSDEGGQLIETAEGQLGG